MKILKKAWFNLATCRAPSDRGSYEHWYCQKRRGHERRTPRSVHVSQAKVHRFNNYVWVDGQHPVYSPVPIDISASPRTDLTPRR